MDNIIKVKCDQRYVCYFTGFSLKCVSVVLHHSGVPMYLL